MDVEQPARREVMRIDTHGVPLTAEEERQWRAIAEKCDMDLEVGPIDVCAICGFYDCACAVLATHAPGCPYLRAATMKVGVGECPHGRDVCVECDACTCSPRGTT